MKRALTILALVPAALAAPAWADCYTVFQRNLIVYRAEMTPIDLEPPIHTQLQKRFPGGQLVISTDVKTCTYIDPSSPVDPATGAAAAPPGSGGTVSVVSGPLAGMSATAATGAAPAAADNSPEVGCRRGGTVTRRGAPCPETTEVEGQRVVGAQDSSVVTDRARPVMRR
ncbi:MAG TPA: hypothetical protein VML91_00645 [Burkholderiales bacterium]|nr:hypothetical protein [Burkholderiales bacterium]